jgi:rhodanese-related sulfurtransferase
MPVEISVDELAAALEDGVWVLDVREVEEFEAGHVPNALHIPLSTIPENKHLIVEHETLYVICKAGGRSMKAATYLEAEGYTVVSVAGGTDEWAASGRNLSFDPSI